MMFGTGLGHRHEYEQIEKYHLDGKTYITWRCADTSCEDIRKEEVSIAL